MMSDGEEPVPEPEVGGTSVDAPVQAASITRRPAVSREVAARIDLIGSPTLTPRHRSSDGTRRPAGSSKPPTVDLAPRDDRGGLRYRPGVSDPFDLLVLGDANPDLVLTGDVEPRFGQTERLVDDALLTVGGSGAIAATGAARLGLRVALCGVVGDDPFGDFLRDELERRGVDVGGLVVDVARPTGVTVVLARTNDRAILTHAGTIADLRTDLIDPGRLELARHVHVSSFFLQRSLAPELPALFGRVRADGATTSVDPNWDPSERWDGGLRDLLVHTDVFLPNATEASLIAGIDELDDAVLALAERAGVVVTKDGAGGALAAHGERLVRAAAPTIDALDTTGAGDAFDAGYLASMLAGDPLERSLAIANACGALSTRAVGGVDAQPTMDEVLTLLSRGDAGR
jgi:sugar/nucleoside kinase (ribokinase family)